MFASREVELQYYRGVGIQRGQEYGALTQVIGRTAILFLEKYFVQAARHIGADMLGFAVLEIADVVSGKQNFQAAAKNVGRQALRKQLGGGSRKRSACKVIPPKSKKRNSRSRRDIFTKVATWKWLHKITFGTRHMWQFLAILVVKFTCRWCLIISWTTNLPHHVTGWN